MSEQLSLFDPRPERAPVVLSYGMGIDVRFVGSKLAGGQGMSRMVTRKEAEP